MKLFGSYTSPYVRHCRMLLMMQSNGWQFVETDFVASAKLSPTKRVPYFDGGHVHLHDSTSIVQWLRDTVLPPQPEGSNVFDHAFLMDRFQMVNTVIDASINLFLLGKEGVEPANSGYLTRQQQRINDCLTAIENWDYTSVPTSVFDLNDVELRLVCLVDWVRFRGLYELDPYTRLNEFVGSVRQFPEIESTHPSVVPQ